jgi:propionyl-CoA carboxylase alpha chain
MPDPETVLACLDKERAYALAAEVGVPHRPLHLASDMAQLRSAADAAGYPCVVRPASESGGLMPGRRKALICPDPGTLARDLQVWPEGHARLVVQAYVHGPRHNLTFVARGGRILSLVQSRSLRTDRRNGTGVGVAGISVPPEARMIEPLAALLEHLRYEGVGLAQFLVPETGDPHFLELNPRLGTAMAFVESCGLDLAVAACRIAAGEEWVPRSPHSYPIGRRYAWTSRDLHGLLVSSGQGDLGRRDAGRWLLSAARTAVEADVHLTWSLRDPMPTLAVFADLATTLARRIARRTAG